MSEILLQTLVEKVTAFQKQVEEMQNTIKAHPDYTEALRHIYLQIKETQTELQAVPGKISIPEQAFRDLEKELLRHTLQLKMPLLQDVRHHHHVNRAVVVCGILVALVFSMVVIMTKAWHQTREHRDSDIKYRYLKLSGAGNGKLLRGIGLAAAGGG